jgi:tetratricopeptide (TPR) repeat protein
MNVAIQLSSAALFLVVCTSMAQDDSGSWRARGIDAYRHARNAEAVRCFAQAVTLDPHSADARLSLALAYMASYIAGVDSPGNYSLGRNAEENLRAALEIDPGNYIALRHLAQFVYWEALTAPSPREKAKRFDQAQQLYQKLAERNPDGKEAFYALGVIAWQQPNRLVDEAIKQLSRALEIDPEYEEPMDYLVLALRKKAAYAAADELEARARKIGAEKIEKWRAAHPASDQEKPCPPNTMCFEPDPGAAAQPFEWPPAPVLLMPPAAPPQPPPPPPIR